MSAHPAWTHLSGRDRPMERIEVSRGPASPYLLPGVVLRYLWRGLPFALGFEALVGGELIVGGDERTAGSDWSGTGIVFDLGVVGQLGLALAF